MAKGRELTPSERVEIGRVMDTLLGLFDRIQSFELFGAPRMTDVELLAANTTFREQFDTHRPLAKNMVARNAPGMIASAIATGMVKVPIPEPELVPSAAGVLMSFLKAMMGQFFNGAPHIAKGVMLLRIEGIENPFTQAPPGKVTIGGVVTDVEPAARTIELAGRSKETSPPCPYCLEPIALVVNTQSDSFVTDGAPLLCSRCGEISVVRQIPGKQAKVFQIADAADVARWNADPVLAASIELARSQWRSGKLTANKVLPKP
jgi:hypothetical protein